MNNFLDKRIQDLYNNKTSLSTKTLKDATGSKEDIENLVKSIKEKSVDRALSLPREEKSSRVDALKLDSNFKSVNTQISNLFERSNKVSEILASISSVLSSEIASLNKEIDIVEKSIKNYAFLLADGKAYDYAFLDPFSDASNFDYSIEKIPDRNGSEFQKSDFAQVNPSSGTLSISSSYNKEFNINPDIYIKNFSTGASAPDLDATLNESVKYDSTSAWDVNFRTSTPLVSPLREFTELYGEEYAGALIAVDYTLSQPSPCDSFTIEPISGSDFELLQVIVFYDNEAQTKQSLLDKPFSLKTNSTLTFPVQAVKKIRCFYKQQSYVRKYQEQSTVELHLNDVYIKKNEKSNGLLNKKLKKLSNDVSAKNLSVPNFSFDTNDDGSIKSNKYNFRVKNKRFDSPSPDLILKSLAPRLNKDGGRVIDTNKSGQSSAALAKSNYTPYKSEASLGVENNKPILKTTSYKYEYSFGIKRVSVGLSSVKERAVYVSNKLPSPGDVGEVKLISSDTDYKDNSYDNPYLTSIEYSVTNVSKPISETDWIPILPSGQISVLSERLFFDEFGTAKLRFPGSYNDNIVVYKNGYSFDINPFGRLILDNNNNIKAININTQSYTEKDIFTAYYTPSSTADVVNFESAGFDVPPLISAYDSSGPGESFDSSGGQLYVALKNYPFIDSVAAAAAQYSPIYGLMGYSPVNVQFEDGTFAVNLTNYASAQNQSALDPNADNITFIHSKNVIMFNRRVTSKFRVYYQYLPANMRVRIVLRSNYKNTVTPQVDYYQVKTKTRSTNALLEM